MKKIKYLFLLLISLLMTDAIGQYQEPKEVVVYYMNGKVDTLNVFNIQVGSWGVTLHNSFGNQQIGSNAYPTVIEKSKIHSINFNGDIKEISGSYDEVENLRLCLDNYRTQRNNGFFTSLVGLTVMSLGGIVNANSNSDGGKTGSTAFYVMGGGALLVGTVIIIDAGKWLNKKRTTPPKIQ
jgi:hypothetical protein